MGLHFCARAFSSCSKWGPLFIAVRGPLTIAAFFLLRSIGSRRAGSVVVAHGPGCSVACGIFPDQGSNPCPLHWQADSQPLRHQGSPSLFSRSVYLRVYQFCYLINEQFWILLIFFIACLLFNSSALYYFLSSTYFSFHLLFF